MLRIRHIDLKQVVSVTTDGAPAMVGKDQGAVTRMKENNPDLNAYHCLIHQTVLCASLSEHFAEVMNTVMKLINFLRASSSLQHRLLREFLEDVEANANDLLLHNNRKLDIFKEDLEGECEHFPKLQEQIRGERDVSLDFINKLIGNFSQRFDSICLGQQLLLLIQNPFLIREIKGFSKEASQTYKWAHAGSLQLELIDLQANAELREHFEATDPATFWLQFVSESVFPGLTKVALHTLTMFGSTYSCESAFSTMNLIKNKHRSRLTNEHLNVCMRMALTPFQPRFKLLAGQCHAHFSH
ncbi:hypothetical protein MHYP_G00308830 [Metynnis hypsauchen]